jgi:hypothetical protein
MKVLILTIKIHNFLMTAYSKYQQKQQFTKVTKSTTQNYNI